MLNIKNLQQDILNNKVSDNIASEIFVEVDNLFLKIKESKGISEADIYFMRLHELEALENLWDLGIESEKIFLFYVIKSGISIYNARNILYDEYGYKKIDELNCIMDGLNVLERKVNRILWLIKDCKDFKNAECNCYFDGLGWYWSITNDVIKMGVQVSKFLLLFNYEGSTLEERSGRRERMFEKIKSGEYPLY